MVDNVARLGNGADELGAFRVFLQLPAQAANPGAQKLHVALVLRAPYTAQQLFIGHEPPSALHELSEQQLLDAREVLFLASYRYNVLLEIDIDVTVGE